MMMKELEFSLRFESVGDELEPAELAEFIFLFRAAYRAAVPVVGIRRLKRWSWNLNAFGKR
jgi:hypothetical protein